MNVRKPVDYGTMYRELTAILTQNLSQMDEVYAIGKAISQRPEKGAAVAAAEFLQANFPDRAGFSPRNVRRMRDFYKTYENDQKLLRLAMKIGRRRPSVTRLARWQQRPASRPHDLPGSLRRCNGSRTKPRPPRRPRRHRKGRGASDAKRRRISGAVR